MQYDQVVESLKSDPSNDELSGLRDELKNLIDLLKQSSNNDNDNKQSSSLPQQQPSSSSFKTGDEILAKYSDNKWYPAKIKAVSGIHPKIVYTVNFRGYNGTEQLSPNQVKELDNTYASKRPRENDHKSLTPEAEKEREKKRKKNEKKAEDREKKNAEMSRCILFN